MVGVDPRKPIQAEAVFNMGWQKLLLNPKGCPELLVKHGASPEKRIQIASQLDHPCGKVVVPPLDVKFAATLRMTKGCGAVNW